MPTAGICDADSQKHCFTSFILAPLMLKVGCIFASFFLKSIINSMVLLAFTSSMSWVHSMNRRGLSTLVFNTRGGVATKPKCLGGGQWRSSVALSANW